MEIGRYANQAIVNPTSNDQFGRPAKQVVPPVDQYNRPADQYII